MTTQREGGGRDHGVPALKVAAPRLVVPSMKVNVPLGAPPPGEIGATKAVNATLWPKLLAIGERVTVVCVLAWLTFCPSTFEVLAPKFESPL